MRGEAHTSTMAPAASVRVGDISSKSRLKTMQYNTSDYAYVYIHAHKKRGGKGITGGARHGALEWIRMEDSPRY